MRNRPDFLWATVKLLVVLALTAWWVSHVEWSVPEILVWN